MAVSLITGKIVYISDQAASILNCKRDVFKNAKFVEFLTPQDVSVFYSFTTPYRLPSWSMCTGAGTTYTHSVIRSIDKLKPRRTGNDLNTDVTETQTTPKVLICPNFPCCEYIYITLSSPQTCQASFQNLLKLLKDKLSQTVC